MTKNIWILNNFDGGFDMNSQKKMVDLPHHQGLPPSPDPVRRRSRPATWWARPPASPRPRRLSPCPPPKSHGSLVKWVNKISEKSWWLMETPNKKCGIFWKIQKKKCVYIYIYVSSWSSNGKSSDLLGNTFFAGSWQPWVCAEQQLHPAMQGGVLVYRGSRDPWKLLLRPTKKCPAPNGSEIPPRNGGSLLWSSNYKWIFRPAWVMEANWIEILGCKGFKP